MTPKTPIPKHTFALQNDPKKMIAKIVKEHRQKQNFTQQELSDVSNISLRSIQRIERGEVMPRMHTLKTLANCLGFSLDFLNKGDKEALAPNGNRQTSTHKKVLISIFTVLLSFLLALAFISQSSGFPETTFELILFISLVLVLVFFVLLKVWGSQSKSQED